MMPTWVLSTLVIVCGSVLALYVGSTLPEYEWLGVYILCATILFTLCAVTNNFPMLMALGIWGPFTLPVPGFRNLPNIAVVMAWIGVILIFRLCLMGSLRYIRSFNWFLLACFLWVPIRFLMNPIHKLGASVEGGSGVSGALPYFGYVTAAIVLVLVGAVLNSRETVMSYMRLSYIIVLIVGSMFLYCAFSPWTMPYLVAMGSFSAGNMGDGIQRLVQLPGYGIFLIEASLCPALFKMTGKKAALVFSLGALMVIIGGNRSALAAAFIFIPIVLFLRRQTHAMMLSAFLGVFGFIGLNFYVASIDPANISPLLRSFGVMNSKIENATGGAASAEWRYQVWQSSMDKILENPLVGKGFGNLPDRLDAAVVANSGTGDFEALLAGGEIHNGFLVASYGFGIPFMLALTIFLLLRIWRHAIKALTTDKHDKELRDLHAMLAGLFASFFVIVYSALDLSQSMIWLYVGISYVLDQLEMRAGALKNPNSMQAPESIAGYPYRYLPNYSKR